jgi:hypothetical protein
METHIFYEVLAEGEEKVFIINTSCDLCGILLEAEEINEH